MAVGTGRGTERGGKRRAHVSRFGGGGWERSHESRGCEEDIFHGVDSRGEAAAKAGSCNSEAHRHGAGGKRTVCGELASGGL